MLRRGLNELGHQLDALAIDGATVPPESNAKAFALGREMPTKGCQRKGNARRRLLKTPRLVSEEDRRMIGAVAPARRSGVLGCGPSVDKPSSVRAGQVEHADAGNLKARHQDCGIDWLDGVGLDTELSIEIEPHQVIDHWHAEQESCWDRGDGRAKQRGCQAAKPHPPTEVQQLYKLGTVRITQ